MSGALKNFGLKVKTDTEKCFSNPRISYSNSNNAITAKTFQFIQNEIQFNYLGAILARM